jgi:hypothetical protein
MADLNQYQHAMATDPVTGKPMPKSEVTLAGSNVAHNRLLIPVTEPKELTIPTYDGSGQAVHPSVIFISTGFGGYKWWMAFTPFPNSDSKKENPSILVSEDGEDWFVPPGVTNPLVNAPAGDGNFNRDPELVWDGTKLYLYYGATVSGSLKTYRMESSNGINWSAPVELTRSDTGLPLGFGSMCVGYFGAEGWIIWDASVNAGQISRWTSTDGLAWKQVGALSRGGFARHTLNGHTLHLSLFADSEGFHFLTSAYRRGGQAAGHNEYDHGVHYGFSNDGLDIFFDPTPAIQPQITGWMGENVYKSSMARIKGSKYRIYFSTVSDTGEWSIGFIDVKLQLSPLLGNAIGIKGKPSNQKKVVSLVTNGQIRDTTGRFINQGVLAPSASKQYVEDWNNYQHHAFVVRNSLDQAVKFSFYSMFGSRSDTINYLNATKDGFDLVTFSIPANGQFTPVSIDENNIPFLGGIHSNDIGVWVKCNTAPTTGSLEVDLVMWN